VLYLLSIPITILFGGSQYAVIIGTGTFVAFYSMAGGIRAVIFTDVIQAIVLLGGGFAAILVTVFKVDGGLNGVIKVAAEDNKLWLGSIEWSWTERTVPTVVIYGLLHYLGRMVGYQDSVQRYLCAPSLKEAQLGLWLAAALSLPTWGLFYFVGTCLYVYYKQDPSRLPDDIDPDAVFPHFIVAEMPAGVAGVVISGVAAAAMSSLDSSLNAISSVVIHDFVKRFLYPDLLDAQYLSLARWVSIGSAALMILGGCALVAAPKWRLCRYVLCSSTWPQVHRSTEPCCHRWHHYCHSSEFILDSRPHGAASRRHEGLLSWQVAAVLDPAFCQRGLSVCSVCSRGHCASR